MREATVGWGPTLPKESHIEGTFLRTPTPMLASLASTLPARGREKKVPAIIICDGPTPESERKQNTPRPPIQISNSHNNSRRTLAISPRSPPELCINLSPNRAQGMPGARCARSLVWRGRKPHELVTTVAPESPGIPRAMVLTVSFVLSLVIGLSCHHPRAMQSIVAS
jgi:hypothetical protein